MARKKKHPEHVNHERWLVSWADLLTLLFAFFVVMFAVSQVDSKKVGRFTDSFRDALEWETMRLPGKTGGSDTLSPLVTPMPHAKTKRNNPGPPTAHNYEDQKTAIRSGLVKKSQSNRVLNGLNILEIKGELVLRLPERLMFDRAEAVLHPEGISALAAISEELQERPVRVRVEGHTDTTPIRSAKFPSNWELSSARAMAVVAFFLEDGRLDPRRLAAAGYGEYHPVSDNETPDGRAKNRRVDLVIVADLDSKGNVLSVEDKTVEDNGAPK